MKIILLGIITLICVSCQRYDKDGLTLLEANNKQINIVIDSILIERWMKSEKSWNERYMAMIEANKENDTVIFGLTYSFQQIYEDELPYIDSIYYGVYEYKNQPILVWNDEFTHILFRKTKHKRRIDFLTPENAIDNLYPVFPFDPEKYNYFFDEKDGKLKFSSLGLI